MSDDNMTRKKELTKLLRDKLGENMFIITALDEDHWYDIRKVLQSHDVESNEDRINLAFEIEEIDDEVIDELEVNGAIIEDEY